MKKTLITGTILTIAIFATTTTFAADGKALYEKNCVKCHGADGKKLPNSDLTNKQLIDKYPRSLQMLPPRYRIRQGANPSNRTHSETCAESTRE